MSTFADRLFSQIERLRAPCVIGLDPRAGSLPRFAWENRPAAARGLGDDAAAVVAWAEAVIEATAPIVPMVKPQSAFYEALGRDGYGALHCTVRSAKEAGL